MPLHEHLPFDLLKTFVLVAQASGDATAAAERLGISQPSISKRLTALRRVTTEPDGQPWLFLKGKRWRLTEEGQRVVAIVSDLVHRYEQMERFVAKGEHNKPSFTIACGQMAASGIVRIALEPFRKQHPQCRVRIATPRAKARIEGVASGIFDIAIVTDSPDSILRTARREMYIEELFLDTLLLAANPPQKSAWRIAWEKLLTNRPAKAVDLLEMPFILPEADAFRRQQFDGWCLRASGRTVDVLLEIGGWQAILDYAETGLGIGLSTQSAVGLFQQRTRSKLSIRPLDPAEFPPDAVRLIARKAHGKDQPELADFSESMVNFLRRI